LDDFFSEVVSVTSLLVSLFFSHAVLVTVLTAELRVRIARVAEFCRVFAFTSTQQNGALKYNMAP